MERLTGCLTVLPLQGSQKLIVHRQDHPQHRAAVRPRPGFGTNAREPWGPYRGRSPPRTHGTPPGRHGPAGSRCCVPEAGYGFGGFTTVMRSAAGTCSGFAAEEWAAR
ncbi:hypothetical protein GCM10010275_66310 [Streptomyces litmocidini]|nr:hypothetical protein GCM10010275_66310 [Streptomyces litmocidini]